MFENVEAELAEAGLGSARMSRMLEALGKTVSGILDKGVSDKELAECFRPLMGSSPTLDEAYFVALHRKVFAEQVRRNIEAEFAQVCQERDMARLLKRLEDAIEGRAALDEPQDDEDAKPIGLDVVEPGAGETAPEALIRRAACLAKEQRRAELKERLKALNEDNAKLQTVLEQRRQEAASQAEELEALLAPYEAAKRLCTDKAN